ncbi:MAG TPA: hypothetical protein VIP09_06290 [Dehalococcoidia bacterium]
MDTAIGGPVRETLAQIVGAEYVLKEAQAVRFSGDAVGPARGSTQLAAAFLAKRHGGWAAHGLSSHPDCLRDE